MYLKHEPSGDLVEVLSLTDLTNPCSSTIAGRFHAGEEIQEPSNFQKLELVFPSGEALPRCWRDAQYKNAK